MRDSQLIIGSTAIVGLSDAVVDHYLPLERLFPSVSSAIWTAYRKRYPGCFGGPDAWRVNMGCYLLRSGGRTILVDAGIGPAGGVIAASLRAPAGGLLPEKLLSLGVRLQDVDVVLLTHLHRDHVGWNVRREGGRSRLTFPRARYVVHQADWETFHRPEAQAAMPDDYLEQAVTPLQILGGLELTSGDLQLTDEVTAVHTPGHTPGHMSVLVSSGGRSAMITGDLIVHPVQVADAGCPFVFDMDVEAARQTRHRLLERIEGQGIVAVGGHLPGAGVLAGGSGKRPSLLAGGLDGPQCQCGSLHGGNHQSRPRHVLLSFL